MKKLIMIVCFAALAGIGIVLLLSRGSSDTDAAPAVYVFEDAVSAVEIHLASAQLVFDRGEAGKTTVTVTGTQAEAVFSEGMLSVTENGKMATKAIVTVSLSEDAFLSTFSAETGAGNVSLQRLNCREAAIDCKVGDVRIDFASMPERLHVKTGTGDVSIQFPGTEPIPIQAPFGLGARDFSDRFIVKEKAAIVIDVSAGNITLR